MEDTILICVRKLKQQQEDGKFRTNIQTKTKSELQKEHENQKKMFPKSNVPRKQKKFDKPVISILSEKAQRKQNKSFATRRISQKEPKRVFQEKESPKEKKIVLTKYIPKQKVVLEQNPKQKVIYFLLFLDKLKFGTRYHSTILLSVPLY